MDLLMSVDRWKVNREVGCGHVKWTELAKCKVAGCLVNMAASYLDRLGLRHGAMVLWCNGVMGTL
jgi:hypothetical protein